MPRGAKRLVDSASLQPSGMLQRPPSLRVYSVDRRSPLRNQLMPFSAALLTQAEARLARLARQARPCLPWQREQGCLARLANHSSSNSSSRPAPVLGVSVKLHSSRKRKLEPVFLAEERLVRINHPLSETSVEVGPRPSTWINL
jgi:hypothetical protein